MSFTSRATIWGIAAAIAVVMIGSLLPIWTVWHVGLQYETSDRGTLWAALKYVPDNWRDSEADSGQFWRLYRWNLVKGFALLATAAFVGWWTFASRWSPATLWIGGILALGVFVAAVLGLRSFVEFVLLSPLLTLYVLLLLITIGAERETQLEPTSGEALNRLVAMKRRGVLLVLGRPRRSQRPTRFGLVKTPSNAIDTEEALDRLVAIKRRMGSPERGDSTFDE